MQGIYLKLICHRTVDTHFPSQTLTGECCVEKHWLFVV